MKKRFVILSVMLLSLFLNIGVLQAQADDLVYQWASDANASSEYGDDSWSAAQATGEPDTESCGDSTSAWASETVSDDEYLMLTFDEAVIPSMIHIFQTYNPGAIVGVSLGNSENNTLFPIPYSADPPGNTGCPDVFTIFLTEDVGFIDTVVIYLDQSLVSSWNEIDAVELIGSTEEYVSLDINTDSVDASSDSGGAEVYGVYVECPDGPTIENGVEFMVNMRSGFTYTATALGIGGFDPVLAVRDTQGTTLCTDDNFDAAEYSAYLPTTGYIEPSNTSSQMPFYNGSNNAFENISVIVGGFNKSEGQFIVVLEGMAVTDFDGNGDPFSVHITPNMPASGVPVTAYMISVTSALDPWLQLTNGQGEYLMVDDKHYWACDNAGTSCWGQSESLSGYYVSRTFDRQLPGGDFDAMMTMPWEPTGLGPADEAYFNWKMTSTGGTYGDYMVVFHAGTSNFWFDE